MFLTIHCDFGCPLNIITIHFSETFGKLLSTSVIVDYVLLLILYFVFTAIIA